MVGRIHIGMDTIRDTPQERRVSKIGYCGETFPTMDDRYMHEKSCKKCSSVNWAQYAWGQGAPGAQFAGEEFQWDPRKQAEIL